MDFYNIAITGIINVMLLVFLEGILYFSILSMIFGNLIGNLTNSAGDSINTLLNNNYTSLATNLNINPDNKDNHQFVSLALKNYLIGFFSKDITTEQTYILNNDLISYVSYAIIFGGLIFALFIVKIVNYMVFSNKYTIQWSRVFLNILITFLLLGIFLIPIVLKVFVNIQSNVDVSTVSSNIIKNFKKVFNS